MMRPFARVAAFRRLFAVSLIVAAAAPLTAQAQFAFTAGDLVVSVEGNGSNTGTYADNQAAPLTLDQFALNGTTSATAAGSLMLPQTASGANYAISGEYGSSSEATLELSGNGQYLTIMGYGINAATYNANPTIYSTACTPTPSCQAALGQSTSLTSAANYVPRVIALISANGTVDTSTALTNIFDGNNPRSAYTANGTSFYVSGQGLSGASDATGGVFYTTLGSSTATSITGADAGSGDSQDTRMVTVYNNQLYVSSDSKGGSTNRSYIGTLGAPGALPTSTANNGAGPTMLTGFGNTGGTGKETITTGANSTGNGLNAGTQINLSPENYWFANSTTLYVADSGDPKNNSTCSGSCTSVGDGGLQKWTLTNGTWVLDYTLATGLNLVSNNNGTTAHGTSGLYGLTGEVVGNTVELFATNFTLADTDQTYLYGITDTLADTQASQVTGETFSVLATATADENFKGVAFAPTSPVPLPATAWLLLSALGGLAVMARARLV